MREDGTRYKNLGRESGVGESDVVGGMGMAWEKLKMVVLETTHPQVLFIWGGGCKWES